MHTAFAQLMCQYDNRRASNEYYYVSQEYMQILRYMHGVDIN